ncbi:MAG: helix-turn-helix domain-containing protein [Frankiaceae bacterium]
MAAGIGERVIELRRQRGWTQSELVEGLPLSASYLSLIEAGRRRPRPAIIQALAARLGTSVEHLTTGRGPETGVLELELRFAELALKAGDPASARTRFAVVHEQAAGRGEPCDAERHEALFGLARADEALGHLEDAIRAFEQLLAAPDLPSSVNRTTVMVGLCRACMQAGDLGRAIDLGERALGEIGVAFGEFVSEEVTELTSTLVLAYYERGDLSRAKMLVDSIVLAGESNGSMRARAAAYWNAAFVAEGRGELRAARQYAERSLALYGELGHAFAAAALRGNVAAYAIRTPGADLEWADAELCRSLDQLAEIDASPADIAAMELELARCRLLAGRIDDAVEIARAALARVEDGAPLERARVQAVLAAALAATGETEEALVGYADAAVALEQVGARRQAATVWRDVAAGLEAMGRTRDALAALERMATALGVPASPVRPVAAIRA